MKAEERRAVIAQTLTADRPISATALAGRFSVSRQIIVGDIALLRAAGLDPDEYTGFYVNIGLDRLVMMRYGVDDVRLFHSADLRFLKQFHLWTAHRPAEPGLPVRRGAVCGEDSGNRPPFRPHRGGSPPPPPLPRRRGLPPGVPGAGQAGRPLHPKRGNWGLTRP